MSFSRILRLALGEVGVPIWRSWFLSLGIAVVVGVVILSFGIIFGLERTVYELALHSLPDSLRVEPALFNTGIMKLESNFKQSQVEELARLPEVKCVYRHARLAKPAQLQANYSQQSFYSDVLIEGVDPGLVEDELSSGYSFNSDTSAEETVPAILPRVMLDVLSSGVSIHTSLPGISPDMLVGRHFTLIVGQSSFAPSKTQVFSERCTIVGISKAVGLGGPTVPLATLERWSDQPLDYYAVTLKLNAAELMPQVERKVRELGYRCPGLELQSRINWCISLLQLALAVFCALLLVIAGGSVFTGISLDVRSEEKRIALYRAIGASCSNIRYLYLVKSLLIGLMGSVFGLAAGLLLGAIFNWVLAGSGLGFGQVAVGSKALVLFQPGLLMPSIAFLVGILTSIAAGLIPSLQATTHSPAQVLAR